MGEVIVVGGGLAGLTCAARLQEQGRLGYLIDTPLTGDGGSLGGFAEFSGAKFSLPPAGLGLEKLCSSPDDFSRIISRVIAFLGLSGPQLVESFDHDLGDGLSHRSYQSFVLTPFEMQGLIAKLESKIPSKKILRERVSRLTREESHWTVEVGGNSINCSCVVVATGRSGATLLLSVGAAPQLGKGLDVGVRLEYESTAGLEALRALGADAKVLSGSCRTFCLNSPGRIYHYQADSGVAIPGGVVGTTADVRSNVGILCRVMEKRLRLDQISGHALTLGLTGAALNYSASTSKEIIRSEILEPFFGSEVPRLLEEFVESLALSNLIAASTPCMVHYPLLDWHWPVFAKPGSFETTIPGLWVVGDLAGHARGLLQSAVSGWLVAEGPL